MNTRYLSSLGLTRGSSVLKTWIPDQVGHDSFVVIPAFAGIHARNPWLLVEARHDSQRGPA